MSNPDDLYPDQLDTITDPTDTDLMLVWDDSESKLKGITVANARTEMQAGAVLASTADAKGDLLVASGADTVTRLAVGTNGYVLTADSAESTGVKWAAAASGGGTTQYGHGSHVGMPGCVAISQVITSWWHGNTYYMPFVVFADIEITEQWVEVVTATTASVYSALYAIEEGSQPAALLATFGALSGSTTGTKKNTGLSITLTPGEYLLAWHHDSGLQFRCPTYVPVTGVWVNSPIGSNLFTSALVLGSVAHTAGVWPDPGTDWTSVGGATTGGISCPIFLKWVAA